MYTIRKGYLFPFQKWLVFWNRFTNIWIIINFVWKVQKNEQFLSNIWRCDQKITVIFKFRELSMFDFCICFCYFGARDANRKTPKVGIMKSRIPGFLKVNLVWNPELVHISVIYVDNINHFGLLVVVQSIVEFYSNKCTYWLCTYWGIFSLLHRVIKNLNQSINLKNFA